jgi:hypothetical protein
MWNSAKDNKPKLGDLVVIKKPVFKFNDECEEVIEFEYYAGIIKRHKCFPEEYLYINVAHYEYMIIIDLDTEWQKIQD